MSRFIAVLAAVAILPMLTLGAPAEAPKVNLNITGHVTTPDARSADALTETLTSLIKKHDATCKCTKGYETNSQGTSSGWDVRVSIKVEGVALTEALDFSASIITASAAAGKVNLTSSVSTPSR